MKTEDFDIDYFRVSPEQSFSLSDYKTDFCGKYKHKGEAQRQLKRDIKELADLQYRLYAENKQALLIIFQAMDAAGKDGSIRHVFSGLNPQGCEVNSFKTPSKNELEHDYLWRHYQKLPPRGTIGIFNRSHYENVLITRVHPEFVLNENLPDIKNTDNIDAAFWDRRYQQIRHFEQSISENGTTIIKFFLHLSRDEQKQRFLERIRRRTKNWKFSSADIEERQYWDDYQAAYEKAIAATSTKQAPWYVIPADNKWFTHVAIGNIIVATLDQMQIEMPQVSKQARKALKDAKARLLSED